MVDPIVFSERIRVDIQALGWCSGWCYLPLCDDVASTSLFYLDRPTVRQPKTPSADDLEIHLGGAAVPDIGAMPPRTSK